MLDQSTFDLLQVGFVNALGDIALQSGPGHSNQRPYPPSAGAKHFLALSAQARRLVLKADSRVSGEVVAVVIDDNPTQRAIR
jgi:hypothetical protein